MSSAQLQHQHLLFQPSPPSGHRHHHLQHHRQPDLDNHSTTRHRRRQPAGTTGQIITPQLVVNPAPHCWLRRHCSAAGFNIIAFNFTFGFIYFILSIHLSLFTIALSLFISCTTSIYLRCRFILLIQVIIYKYY